MDIVRFCYEETDSSEVAYPAGEVCWSVLFNLQKIGIWYFDITTPKKNIHDLGSFFLVKAPSTSTSTGSVGYQMRPWNTGHEIWLYPKPPPLQKVAANPAPAAPCQLSAPPSSCLPNDIPNETSGGSVSHTGTVWANQRGSAWECWRGNTSTFPRVPV